MTVVRNELADAYVRKPQQGFRFFLLHGGDQGLIHERAATLVKALLKDSFGLTRIDGESIVREPGRVADEAYASPMLSDDRVLWIDAKSRDVAKSIEPLIADPPAKCWLVVEASNLKRGSRLRSAFEKADNAVSIECYPDDRRTLAAIIDDEVAAAGFEISDDARGYLLRLLGADRLTTRGELAKLLLYAKGNRRIDVADIVAIVTDSGPSGLNELIDGSLLGEMAQIEGSAGRFFGGGGDPALLISRLASQVNLLHSVRLEVEMGASLETALQKHLVRLPPAGRTALTRQVQRWSIASLKKRSPAVQKASARIRRDERLARLLALRALWGIASA
jgi:DNA polymerase-3 subunit delta